MLHLLPALTAYILTLTAVLGLVMGSFAACTAGRLAAGEDFLRSRSRCDACGHTLSPRDLVPVFSWLFLRGRCRYCGARIPARCPLTELLCAAAFLGIVLRYDVTLIAFRDLAAAVLLLIAALVDYDTGILPDGLTGALAVNFLLFAGLQGGDIWARIWQGFLGGAAAAVPLLALAKAPTENKAL